MIAALGDAIAAAAVVSQTPAELLPAFCPGLPCPWQVGAVIVSPTRELARQIFTVAQPLPWDGPWLHTLLLVGGT